MLSPGIDRVIDALDLPPETLRNKRVPKKSLLEHGRLSRGDRKLIQEAMKELTWVANLSPATVGLGAGGTRKQGEAQVFALQSRPTSRLRHLATLVHRAISYPLLLVTEAEGRVLVSSAHVRTSEVDTTKTVTEDVHMTDDFDSLSDDDAIRGFLSSLSLSEMRPAHLEALVDSWISRIEMLAPSSQAGGWIEVEESETELLRNQYSRYLALSRDLDRLTREAHRERQMNRLAELNQERQRIRIERDQLLASLQKRVRGELEQG